MTKKLEAVIFDWAGTMVDFGSFAPTQIFVDAFKSAFDVELTLEEARGPMGLGKWQHIAALGQHPLIARRWFEKFGRSMSDDDVRHVYETFIPLQVERVGLHSRLIPGALETVQALRGKGIKIASTTGYPRQVMIELIRLANEQGYHPDCTVCADDLPAGSRPGPWMALDCVQQLQIHAVGHCVKVDDTLPGIEEGLNAGMWTVGLALSGSPAGLTLEEFIGASKEQKDTIRSQVETTFKRSGSHYVIDTVADLMPVIQHIEQRILNGQRP